MWRLVWRLAPCLGMSDLDGLRRLGPCLDVMDHVKMCVCAISATGSCHTACLVDHNCFIVSVAGEVIV